MKFNKIGYKILFANVYYNGFLLKTVGKLHKTVISRYSLLNVVNIFAQNILKMGDGWDWDFEHKIPLGFILFTVVACNFKVYDLKFTIVDYTSV
jgi:hypothetical protein